ncbi:hypothetical protein PFLUV_G00105800 [Perca fluviatilis]|uniref:Nardilysin n=1 Tax=Perca fluviatilis TaxID=8168 RepID=A0A6A5FB16_PERFL|nr:hypothetical protein PFLUV_G00105800 [Perca fluviatilis]
MSAEIQLDQSDGVFVCDRFALSESQALFWLTATRPKLGGCTETPKLLSTLSKQKQSAAATPENSVKMPQTNKSASSGGAQGQVSSPDQGEPPPPSPPPQQEVRAQVAAGDGGAAGGVAADDQGDAEIISSPSDPKKYRYIELSNGLRALLISDFSGADGQGDSEDGEDKADTEDREEGEAKAEEEGDSGEGSDEDEEEDEEEEQDSDFDELDEDSAGRTKRGNSEKQAAAALCISVGSFSDPDDLPGLAHFLEHMVFMGSEKYPAENGFDAFLKKHGGSDNASTDCERTIFQFDVQRKYFREALDRWAQFFICPLMIEDAIDREVEAVDSEYQLARPSDSHRKEMLFGSLAKPGHPMGKFCWGNAQTLKHEPREKQINTYQRLRDFWKRYYSAHYMTLAVQSKETLDTLEEWVREIFTKVPNNGEPRADFSHLLQPFDTPAFNKLYRVVPVRKVHALTISWAVPPQVKHYRVKPLHYISWLIGHEGTGSILSLLRKKCWALALGGNSETGFDQNTTYSIFSISITLTNQGYQNFYQVVHLVFQYLKMLQTLGPQQRIYEEIQKIEANEFHYQEQTDPIEFVENICENMQLFPKEDFLTGDQLMFEFDPQVISAALSPLTPDRANLLLLSPENEGHCPLREKWFGTCYSEEDIPEEWSQRWTGDFELNSELHLPAENRFIATDFTLKESDCPDSEFPIRTVNSERGCLWYKKDNKFKIPKAGPTRPTWAQLEYKLVAGEHGLVVRLKGFNHKLPLLLKLIVDHLAEFRADPGVFNMFSEQLKKTYFNILIKPERLGKDVRLQILEHSRWSVIQEVPGRHQGSDCDLPSRRSANRLKAELFVEGGAGKLHPARCVHLVFQYLKDAPDSRPQQRIYEEIQKIEKREFHYQEQGDQRALSPLTPDRANLLLLSPGERGHCPLRESDIPEEWSQRWTGDFELNSELHLPAENRFIAAGCLWYKKDNKFKIPKAYIRFNLISPIIQKSPENLVLFDLFVNVLAHNLAEPAYEADVAQLEYKLVAGEHGLVVRLKGFNHKLPLLLKLMRGSSEREFRADRGVFNMFSEQLKKPTSTSSSSRRASTILEHSRWSVIQKYQAVTKGLTVDDLTAFATGLKAELFVEGLVQGNFTSTESKEFLQYFIDKLQFQPLSAEVPVLFRVVELPHQHHLCKVKSLNKGDANSEVTVYYQSGLKNLREHALMELMVMHMEEPCFDFLRTKETLGYQVYPTCRNTSGVLGFSVTVETQATKFSTEFVEAKIEEFLASFGERLSALSEDAFRTQVTALIKLKECEDAHLGEEVDRNWFEVVTQQYVFKRLDKEIEALKLFSQQELVSWFLEHRNASSRKLSVHVVGFGVEENDPPEPSAGCCPGSPDNPPSSSYGEVSELTFLPSASRDAALITDIRAFTSSLTLHPYHKILS